MLIEYFACMAIASKLYNLPPRILPTIFIVEGGKPGLISNNSNNTQDLGIMQVNTIWIKLISKYNGQSEQEIFDKLVYNPCYNIEVAAAIIAYYRKQEHGNLLVAIGDYHSHSPEKNKYYQRIIIATARQLFEKVD